MKKVIFEQPADTIEFKDLKLTDFIGVQIQNTKAFLVVTTAGVIPVLKNLSEPSGYSFSQEAAEEGLKKFTHVYKFSTLQELITWLGE